ncbi:hypothetical protein [Fluviicola sp.]|uniref:hypothetical protein n=1 Tax=Fluviicola sp. TaxID=1917219 RepID=UPI002615023D|nr:hypothetical protein [Fluviicola sp.]
MKTITLSICFIWSLTGFTQTNTLSKAPFTDSTFAILEIDTTNNCSAKLNGYLQGEFDKDDLSLIDSLLRPFIAERTNGGYPFRCGREIHDYLYYYQFIAIKNNKGEKIIWVNAFCPSFLKTTTTLSKHEKRQLKKEQKQVSQEPDWHKQIICAYDGCGCFWELKINLANKSIFDIQVSGL